MRQLLIWGIGFVLAIAHVEANEGHHRGGRVDIVDFLLCKLRPKNQHCHCKRGPRGDCGEIGPRGSTGATGPTGPTGPAVALSGSYACFYSTILQQQSLGTESESFQFDQYYTLVGIIPSNSQNTSAISLDVYDTFEITQNGVYLITWSFNIGPEGGVDSPPKKVAATLYKNDTPLEPTSYQACVTVPFGDTTPIPLRTCLSGSLSIPLADGDKIQLQVEGSIEGQSDESVATLSGGVLTITQISSSL